jgi:CHC2 zinc finger
MPRIPEDVIERLKKEVSLERLAEARGIELQRHGADLIGRCPFHDDKTPSLVISPKKNLWHCLGACSTGGTAIDWVMRAEGVSFRHAVELLTSGEWKASNTGAKISTVRKLAPPIEVQAAKSRRAAPGGRVLSRRAEGIAGGFAVSGVARADASGDDLAL